MRRLFLVLPFCAALSFAQAPTAPVFVDLEGDVARQSTVHRVGWRYQGHPTTVLLPDGTILCVHPEGHGKGPILLQKSSDGGRTWSEPLPVPENWASSQETPTIHRLVDRTGKARLCVFSGMRPIRRALSEDEGRTWTPLEPIGEFGGIVAMASVVALANGEHAAFFHDDGRWEQPGSKKGAFTVFQTRSGDGGRTWSAPTVIWQGSDVHLCEPGVVRSPDGKRLAMLLRENRRAKNSHVSFSTTKRPAGRRRWSCHRACAAIVTSVPTDRMGGCCCRFATWRRTARRAATGSRGSVASRTSRRAAPASCACGCRATGAAPTAAIRASRCWRTARSW